MDKCTPRPREVDSTRQTFLWAFLPTLLLSLGAPPVGDAQVVTNITSSGLNTQVNQVGNSYNVTGGTRPGAGPNLFHSFGNFTVGPGDTANFSTFNTPPGTVPIANILGRVTGGNISNIYGTLQTTEFGNANLFLMNPSGIVLGPGASLNVGGSVSFTTAQYIRLFDGLSGNANFYANPANDGLTNSILTINASAFEFLSATPAGYGFLTAPDPNATITVQGSTLSVPSGQSISLVGGKVVIEGGAKLTAQSGRIHVATTASPGEFAASESLANATSLTPLPNNPVDPTAATTFTSYGTVSLTPGSSLDIHGTSTVLIKGGQLVASMNEARLNTSENPAPSETISLGPGSSILTSNSGPDPGADVQITAGAVNLDGSKITTETFGDGNGGNLTANVRTLALTNGAVISSGTSSSGSGQGGNITVQGLQGFGNATEAITLDTLSSIRSETNVGLGHGGNIGITAESVTLNGTSEVRTGTFFGGGIGGGIDLNVGRLVLNGGSKIQTSDFTFGSDLDFDGVLDTPSTGAGGQVTIQGLHGTGSAAKSVELLDQSQIISEAVDGKGGQLSIGTTSLNLTEASSITSSTFGLGQGGHIMLSVQDATISGSSFIASRPAFFNPTTAGEPGNITIRGLGGDGSKADSLIITGFRSGILQDTYGTAAAGDIIVHARTVSLTNEGVIEGGTIQGEGTGGKVTVDADTVNISSGSHFSSQARFQDAGQVTITANALIMDRGSIETSTSSESGGRGGDAVLNVGSATIRNGSSISASSTGNGNAGNITINSTSNVIMQNSSVTTEARQASGGQITINAPDMIRLTDSHVSTSVAGAAGDSNGGNISIDPDFVILKGSQILAQAFAGSGGAIGVTAGLFLADPASVVDASSTLGVSGTVQINAPINNLSSVVARLPESLLAVQALLRASCAAKLAQGATSSFVERGRDGIPAGPDGLLASPYLPPTSGYAAQQQTTPSTGFSGIQLRRLFRQEMPASVTLVSDHGGCVS